MACSDYDEFWEALADFSLSNGQALLDAVICPYDAQVGMLVFATVVFGTVALALIALPGSRSGKLGLVLVLAMVIGPIYVSHVPAQFTQIAVFVIVVGITVAFYHLYAKREQSF